MPLPPLSEMDGEILDATWYVHLRKARSDHEVLACVREFLDALSPREISRLPMLTLDIVRPEEIPLLSSRLATAYEQIPDGSGDRPIFMRTIALLCYATDRLSQVPVAASRKNERAGT